MAKRTIMSATDHQEVSEAVTRAEAGSAGEIVTIVTDQSDDYADIALAWSAAVALLVGKA